MEEEKTLSAKKKALLEQRLKGTFKRQAEAPRIAKRAADTPVPLSFAQRQMWVIDQMMPGNPAYNLPVGYRIKGNLNVHALEESFNAVIQRHEILRTTFSVQDGEPAQVIHPECRITIASTDLDRFPEGEREARVHELASEESIRPFDLSRLPLVHVSLFKLGGTEHVLVINIHHILADGLSVGLMWDELDVFYRAFTAGGDLRPPALTVQYGDFALWQSQHTTSDVFAGQFDFWRKQLHGKLPVLELPRDRSRPALQSFNGSNVFFNIPGTLAQDLKSLGAREGCTFFITLLAAFQVLLQRYSGAEDIIIGTPVAVRNAREVERLIGNFLNMTALRCDLSGDPTFVDLLQRSRNTTLDAFSNGDLPFESMIEHLRFERDPSRNPIFQVGLQLLSASEPKIGDLEVGGFRFDLKFAQFDLTLHLYEETEGYSGRFEYCSDLFEAQTIRRLSGNFLTLLEEIIRDPGRRISKLPLLTEVERRQLLVEWNDTATDYPAEALLHELFERQAQRTPDAVAIVFEGQCRTYRELDARANQLARRLQEHGVGADTLVALCVERSLEMMVGLLGILKAGGAYVPLDPSYPAERLAFMLEDTQAPVLLTQARLLSRLPTHRATTLCLDTEWHTLEHLSTEPPPTLTRPTHLAYIIYTSGSTGKPKGACITHRGVVNYLSWAIRAYKVAEGTGAPVHSSIAFDLTVTSLLAPLLVGRTVELLPDDQGVEALAKALLTAAGYSLVKLTPAHLQLLQLQLPVNEVAERTRAFVIGGEQLQAEAVAFWRKHAPQTLLVNEYGPTETVVGCCVYTVTPETLDEGAIPIGRPIGNTQLYILDRHMEPVPIGVTGELYIGGDGVARGYWNQPLLTADRFVPNPFSDARAARLYRTGDLARYLSDGNIEFLGRIDHQVKLRGYRIELGEIEAKIAQHPAVREVVVLAREVAPGDKRLVAYVVAEDAATDLVERLRAYLRASLPEYMVPSHIVGLQALPLTTNGKVDREALPSPNAGEGAPRAGIVEPRTATEKLVESAFREVLDRADFGVFDNFFELGGHSLMAARLMFKLRAVSGLDLPLRNLFESPTVAGLAETMDGLSWLTKSNSIQSASDREEIEV
jgi:amino acid adenylation domain-containing protein